MREVCRFFLRYCHRCRKAYNAALRTIAVINQKGGVGKTTTVANLGAAVAAAGVNVCLVDLDPQGHLTLHYGIEPDDHTLSAYDVLTRECTVPQATQMLTPHLSLIPATIDLAAVEGDLAAQADRANRLGESFAAQPLPHDLVLIDCPPSLGMLTLNALALADDVVIPLQAHFLALQGLGKLLETVELVQQRINPRIRVAGVVLCMFESVTRLAAEVVSDLREFFASARDSGKPWDQARIFSTVIRRNIKLAESPSYGKTIFEYEPRSHGADDYHKLGEEFVKLFVAPDEPQPQPVAPVPVPVPTPVPVTPSPPVAPQTAGPKHSEPGP